MGMTLKAIQELEDDGNTMVYPVGVVQTDEEAQDFAAFKDSSGRFRTQSLFWEMRSDKYPAFFTFKKRDIERDGRHYISLYRKYMEIADPTEYQVALRCFGSWDHWQMLTSTKWFREHLAGWRDELKVKLESDRYYETLDHAKGEGQSALSATKWLASRYGDQTDAKRGRPSKAEVEKHLKQVAEETAELEDDAERIGL